MKDDTWKASIEASINGARFAHRINLGGYSRDIKGIQYVSENNGDLENPGWSVLEYDVRSTFRTTRLSADYSLVRKRADEYAWRVDAGVAYNKQKDRYLLPEARKNSSGVYTHLTAKYNFNLGDKMNRRLLIAATGGVMSAGKGNMCIPTLSLSSPPSRCLRPAISIISHPTTGMWAVRPPTHSRSRGTTA